ncbi:unnamed protein product [Gordionus sp. m RMFG-2023]
MRGYWSPYGKYTNKGDSLTCCELNWNSNVVVKNIFMRIWDGGKNGLLPKDELKFYSLSKQSGKKVRDSSKSNKSYSFNGKHNSSLNGKISVIDAKLDKAVIDNGRNAATSWADEAELGEHCKDSNVRLKGIVYLQKMEKAYFAAKNYRNAKYKGHSNGSTTKEKLIKNDRKIFIAKDPHLGSNGINNNNNEMDIPINSVPVVSIIDQLVYKYEAIYLGSKLISGPLDYKNTTHHVATLLFEFYQHNQKMNQENSQQINHPRKDIHWMVQYTNSDDIRYSKIILSVLNKGVKVNKVMCSRQDTPQDMSSIDYSDNDTYIKSCPIEIDSTFCQRRRSSIDTSNERKQTSTPDSVILDGEATKNSSPIPMTNDYENSWKELINMFTKRNVTLNTDEPNNNGSLDISHKILNFPDCLTLSSDINAKEEWFWKLEQIFFAFQDGYNPEIFVLITTFNPKTETEDRSQTGLKYYCHAFLCPNALICRNSILAFQKAKARIFNAPLKQKSLNRLSTLTNYTNQIKTAFIQQPSNDPSTFITETNHWYNTIHNNKGFQEDLDTCKINKTFAAVRNNSMYKKYCDDDVLDTQQGLLDKSQRCKSFSEIFYLTKNAEKENLRENEIK